MASTSTASSSTRTRTTATTAEEGGDGGGPAARLIDYARRVHAYKLTPAEAEEILRCDYWLDVDDFVTYMRQFAPPPCAATAAADDHDDASGGSGDGNHHPDKVAVNATEDVVVPGLHLYTDAEVDAMDAWDNDDDVDETEEDDEATDGHVDVGSRWVSTSTTPAAFAAAVVAEVSAPHPPSHDDAAPGPRHRSRGLRGPRALARRFVRWVSRPPRLPSSGQGAGGRRLLDKARGIRRAWDGLVAKRRGDR